MERLNFESFLYGLRDAETMQALLHERPDRPIDTLYRALELKAVKKSCRN